ncbi:uncharacterized protein LY89DRAFT_688411 [Mollisia scopiformis]|uniref:Uncharacterized protein n=1 Tax=Mollisia scopiformis TaxID=149040 RepID=A0A194WVD4_MOLSC|nr:uncharacterized protein LY89DRAFT_688411 [Mollisia scopiformis]KUJ11928.1 hypothetical protein LY89DRAFT_688411 [Mollisia scopiformis]
MGGEGERDWGKLTVFCVLDLTVFLLIGLEWIGVEWNWNWNFTCPSPTHLSENVNDGKDTTVPSWLAYIPLPSK